MRRFLLLLIAIVPISGIAVADEPLSWWQADPEFPGYMIYRNDRYGTLHRAPADWHILPPPLAQTVFVVVSEEGQVRCAVEARPFAGRRSYGQLTEKERLWLKGSAVEHAFKINATTSILNMHDVHYTYPMSSISVDGLFFASSFEEKGVRLSAFVFSTVRGGHIYRSQCILPETVANRNIDLLSAAATVAQGLGFTR